MNEARKDTLWQKGNLDELLSTYGETKIVEFEDHAKNDILKDWLLQQNADRKLRKGYGIALLILLAIVIVVFTAIFVLSVFNIVHIDSSTIHLWLAAMVIEVIGLVTVVAKGLFINTTKEFYTLIKALVGLSERE